MGVFHVILLGDQSESFDDMAYFGDIWSGKNLVETHLM